VSKERIPAEIEEYAIAMKKKKQVAEPKPPPWIDEYIPEIIKASGELKNKLYKIQGYTQYIQSPHLKSELRLALRTIKNLTEEILNEEENKPIAGVLTE